MSAKMVGVMDDAAIASAEERIAAVVRTVAASYGGRQQAHRLVMSHSLSRGGNRLAPLLAKLTEHLASERPVGAIRHALSRADAFVLAHALAGVLRAMTREPQDAPGQEEVAEALSRLVVGFMSV